MCDSDPTNVEERINAEASRLEAAIEAEVRRIEEQEYIQREARRRIDERYRQRKDAISAVSQRQRELVLAAAAAEAQAKASAAAAAEARAVAEARLAAEEQHRQAVIAHGERKAAALASWLQTAQAWPLGAHMPAWAGELRGVGWTQQTLEPEFWKWVVEHGGFSSCPTCGQKPTVLRKASRQNPHSNTEEVHYTEGLWSIWEISSHLHVTGELEHISCCEHLWEFKTRRRLIHLSKMVARPAVVVPLTVITERFETLPGQGGLRGRDAFGREAPFAVGKVRKARTEEYALFNPEDPDGSKAAEAKRLADRLHQLERLRAQIASLENNV